MRGEMTVVANLHSPVTGGRVASVVRVDASGKVHGQDLWWFVASGGALSCHADMVLGTAWWRAASGGAVLGADDGSAASVADWPPVVSARCGWLPLRRRDCLVVVVVGLPATVWIDMRLLVCGELG